jgi:hypothetical protein
MNLPKNFTAFVPVAACKRLYQQMLFDAEPGQKAEQQLL